MHHISILYSVLQFTFTLHVSFMLYKLRAKYTNGQSTVNNLNLARQCTGDYATYLIRH